MTGDLPRVPRFREGCTVLAESFLLCCYRVQRQDAGRRNPPPLPGSARGTRACDVDL